MREMDKYEVRSGGSGNSIHVRRSKQPRIQGDAMTFMAHDPQCMALRQLETALCLYFEQEDYYSVITLAGASEEMFSEFLRSQLKAELGRLFKQEDFVISLAGALDEIIDKLRKKFEENDKLRDEILAKLQGGEAPDQLQAKLQLNGHRDEKKLLKELEEIIGKELREVSGEKNDQCKNCLKTLKEIFDLHKPLLDSLTDAAIEIGRVCDGKAPTRRSVIRAANWVRNILKHGLCDGTQTVEFDAKEMAKDMLDRAIENYSALTRNLTPAMEQFQNMHVKNNAVIRDWCSEDNKGSRPGQ